MPFPTEQQIQQNAIQCAAARIGIPKANLTDSIANYLPIINYYIQLLRLRHYIQQEGFPQAIADRVNPVLRDIDQMFNHSKLEEIDSLTQALETTYNFLSGEINEDTANTYLHFAEGLYGKPNKNWQKIGYALAILGCFCLATLFFVTLPFALTLTVFSIAMFTLPISPAIIIPSSQRTDLSLAAVNLGEYLRAATDASPGSEKQKAFQAFLKARNHWMAERFDAPQQDQNVAMLP